MTTPKPHPLPVTVNARVLLWVAGAVVLVAGGWPCHWMINHDATPLGLGLVIAGEALYRLCPRMAEWGPGNT